MDLYQRRLRFQGVRAGLYGRAARVGCHVAARQKVDRKSNIRYRVGMTKSALSNRTFAAFLFDMDGTILNSIEAAERVWTVWARRHGLDVEASLPTIHGVRGFKTISRLQLPGVDPYAEAREILLAEIEDVVGIEAIAGAATFLASLPEDRWAIVTSSPRQLAVRRLAAAGLPHPKVFITGEDVERGKPAPDCFLLAARRLGQPIEDCLVFEDARRPVSRPPRPPARASWSSLLPTSTRLGRAIPASWGTRPLQLNS